MPFNSSQQYVRERGVNRFITDDPAAGKHLFVCSVTGTDGSSYGSTPDSPVATIDYAVGLCTASKGDTIHVLPGHAETISGATGCVFDVAGVRMRGYGWGTLKPVLTFSATASILSVTAANCWLEGIRIISDIDNCVTAISAGASADGLVIKDVEILDGATNKEFLIHLAIAAACHDVTVDGLKVWGLAGGATACISLAGASDRFTLRNSILQGTFSTALISASAAASANVLIADNVLVNRDAAGICYVGHASTTGFIMGSPPLGAF